jgi:hypothetical protein
LDASFSAIATDRLVVIAANLPGKKNDKMVFTNENVIV